MANCPEQPTISNARNFDFLLKMASLSKIFSIFFSQVWSRTCVKEIVTRRQPSINIPRHNFQEVPRPYSLWLGWVREVGADGRGRGPKSKLRGEWDGPPSGPSWVSFHWEPPFATDPSYRKEGAPSWLSQCIKELLFVLLLSSWFISRRTPIRYEKISSAMTHIHSQNHTHTHTHTHTETHTAKYSLASKFHR